MMDLRRTFIWRKLREIRILRTHMRVASICQELIRHFQESKEHFVFSPKQDLGTDKIIWQYWNQGYENLPPVVSQCLSSVDQFAGEYRIIRLSDDNLEEYIECPVFLLRKRSKMTPAYFSDILRLILLKTYGGIWLDATIFLSGPIPEQLAMQDFFVFRRDPEEPNYRYWRNVYAYYFGWAKGFQVNMLNSFIVARKNNETVSDLCDLMLLWWMEHDDLPDYFFFQILFDVYVGNRCTFPLESDTRPHYLQQSRNDSHFSIMSQEDILRNIPIHKLTYK